MSFLDDLKVLRRGSAPAPESRDSLGAFVLAAVNLVRNAAQAASGDAALEIQVSIEGERVVIAFQDDGPGVPSEAAPRLFESGFSLRGGSGLGLAFVRAVIEEEMTGQVSDAPAEGSGACFRLLLPLAGGETWAPGSW